MKERFSLTIHWLVTVILMIGLYLYPTVATVSWVKGWVPNEDILETLLIGLAGITGIFILFLWLKWVLTGGTQIWPHKKIYDFWGGWLAIPAAYYFILIILIAATPK